MGLKWWVWMDWAGAHRVRLTEIDLSAEDGEWTGPFDGFTQMRNAILDAGTYEASLIHEQQRDWRYMRKGDVELVDW